MASIDVFNSDPFTLTSLTAAIQNIPYKPSRISELGLFSEDGITTLDAYIEQENGVLSLVPVAPRGAPASGSQHASRVGRSFRVPHLPKTDYITADAIIGVRAFGTESEEVTMAKVIAQRMTPMVNSIQYTIEAHRMASIKGAFYDSTGTVRSLFTEFGVTQQTVAFVITDDATKVRVKCMDTLRKIEDALDGLSFTGVRVLCGDNFWDLLIEHPEVNKTYLAAQDAAEKRGDPRLEFTFGGLIFERYRGTSDVNIGTDDAYAIPEGVTDLFITRYAPADYMETVGTIGQSMYAKQWQLPNGKAVTLEVQSNPLNLCTRPRAVIKLTK